MTATNSAPVPSRRALHTALAVLVLAALLIFSAAQATYLMYAVKEEANRAAAMSGVSLVNYYARFLATASIGGPRPEDFDEVHRDLTYSIPGAELYLIDEEGRVETAAGLTIVIRSRIDPEPLRKFVALPHLSDEALLMDDPGEAVRKAVFVAAPLEIDGQLHYLVLTLERVSWLRTFRFAFDEKVIYFIVATVLVQALLGVLLALVFYRMFTVKIRDLLNVLRRFTGGEYSARSSVTGTDELSELAAVTNTMAETIEQTVAQLAERDRRRRELIADVTHDLRAPTSVIRSTAEQITALSSSSAESRQLVASMIRSSESLGRLLGQLWELSRLETRDRPLSLDRLPLAELTQEIAEGYRTLAADRRIELIAAESPEPYPVLADSDLITRAIANLIENALTYTPAGGRVEVSVTADDGQAIVSVADSGVGMSHEEMEKIFDRAYRSERWRHRREDSSGLGLAIVRNILEAHGARIAVESRENEGSRFYFSLPLAAPVAAS